MYRGKDVLQKPELSKVLEQRKATQKRKEWAQEQASKRTSFELKLEQQANKIKEVSLTGEGVGVSLGRCAVSTL